MEGWHRLPWNREQEAMSCHGESRPLMRHHHRIQRRRIVCMDQLDSLSKLAFKTYWPMHTPNIGILPANSFMASRLIPESVSG